MKAFFGVDEEPEKTNFQDAASLTAAIEAQKLEQECDATGKSLAVTKSNVIVEEGIVEEEEEIEDTVSTTSSQFTAPPV